MDSWIWGVIAFVAAVIVYGFFGRTKSKKSSETISTEEAHSWASREFRRSFPDDQVDDVVGDKDLDTFFLNLSDGKVGIYRSRRGKGKAIIVEQGRYRLRALPETNGLQVDYLDNDFFSGNYFFTSEKDASDASNWLLNAR